MLLRMENRQFGTLHSAMDHQIMDDHFRVKDVAHSLGAIPYERHYASPSQS
jgi:hypothetical protein